MDDVVSVGFRLLSDWHCGAGKGRSATLDAVVARDDLGLPVIPGRTVKGLLREAVRQASATPDFQGLSIGEPAEAMLFGTAGFLPPQGEDRPQPYLQTRPGRLAVGDAVVDPEIAAYVRSASGQERAARAATLFRAIAMTAIDPEPGIVRKHSLRMIEVAVPLTMTCEVRLLPEPPSHPGETVIVDKVWRTAIELALPFLRGVGAHRTRGLGRCAVSMIAEGALR